MNHESRYSATHPTKATATKRRNTNKKEELSTVRAVPKRKCNVECFSTEVKVSPDDKINILCACVRARRAECDWCGMKMYRVSRSWLADCWLPLSKTTVRRNRITSSSAVATGRRQDRLICFYPAIRTQYDWRRRSVGCRNNGQWSNQYSHSSSFTQPAKHTHTHCSQRICVHNR